jgi:hypothetical protein
MGGRLELLALRDWKTSSSPVWAVTPAFRRGDRFTGMVFVMELPDRRDDSTLR